MVKGNMHRNIDLSHSIHARYPGKRNGPSLWCSFDLRVCARGSPLLHGRTEPRLRSTAWIQTAGSISNEEIKEIYKAL